MAPPLDTKYHPKDMFDDADEPDLKYGQIEAYLENVEAAFSKKGSVSMGIEQVRVFFFHS